MKFVDEVMGIIPGHAQPEEPHYVRYQAALKWLTVGVIGEVLGLAAYSLGVKTGLDLSAAAIPVQILGSAGLGLELPKLSDTP